MRSPALPFLTIFALAAVSLAASTLPLVSSADAAKFEGKGARIFGRVIEVRRVAKGPIIFELDGKPAAPAFRALVYPDATGRFGATPENVYLGQMVEVTGVVIVRKNLPQMWLSDPCEICLFPAEQAAVSASPTPTSTPAPTPAQP